MFDESPRLLLTHPMPLEQGPRGYDLFKNKGGLRPGRVHALTPIVHEQPSGP
jgi:hypothetical protein